MADYAKSALGLKARLDQKIKRRLDLTAFFEGLRSALTLEVAKANIELLKVGAPKVEIQQASLGEPTIELVCDKAICHLSQDRGVPSIGAILKGESGEQTITFLVLVDESPLKACRISLTPEIEEKVDAVQIAATFVDALIAEAP